MATALLIPKLSPGRSKITVRLMVSSRYQLKLNVAAILQDAKGRILICERHDVAGAWQFPQGGVDDGESIEQALERELAEEISLQPGDYTPLIRKGPYRYLYGDGRTKKGYHGKEQHYFLASLTAPASRIDVRTAHPEFQAARWIFPREFDIGWLPPMKRDVYRAVMNDFFDVQL